MDIDKIQKIDGVKIRKIRKAIRKIKLMQRISNSIEEGKLHRERCKSCDGEMQLTNFEVMDIEKEKVWLEYTCLKCGLKICADRYLLPFQTIQLSDNSKVVKKDATNE
jgi:PHP family Zn ribbon phosphoesterase